jgi:hypothetical protein
VGEFTLRLIVLALLCPATHTFCQAMNPPIYCEVIPTSSGFLIIPQRIRARAFRLRMARRSRSWSKALLARAFIRALSGWGKLRTRIFRRSSPRRPNAYGNNIVSQCTIDAVTAVLGPSTVSQAAAGNSPVSVAVDPSGKYAYVVNRNDNTISMFIQSIATVRSADRRGHTGKSPFAAAVTAASH